MPKYLAKRIIWVIILVVMLFGFSRLTLMIDSIIVYYNEGADPASALKIVPNVPVDLYVKLDWQHDDADPGRAMDATSRTEIQSAYLRAWLQWNISLAKQIPYGIETYFTGPALSDIDGSIHQVTAKGWQVEQADMAHDLKLHFYSADGSIVSFTDSNVDVVNIIQDQHSKNVFISENLVSYQVVMILADGNWRVRHWVQMSSQNLATSNPAPSSNNFVSTDPTRPQLLLRGHAYHIAGINYYPTDAAWDRFWVWYNPKTIDYDFNIIDSLKLNTIRIFVPFDQFGGPDLSAIPTVTATATSSLEVQQPLKKLDDLLKRASAHQLHVIVTLFDFHSDYDVLQWPSTDRQLEILLTHYKNNPTILAWDLKNEPDQDYRAASKYLVNAWLTHSSYLAHRYDPNHLLTIGWSTAEAARIAIPGTNFVSFHDYTPASTLPAAYQAIRSAHQREPIVLGEFGLPTWNSFFFPGGHTEAEQATYYASILRFLRASDSSGYLAWTLYDFRYASAKVVGFWPWQAGPQKTMGVLHTDASPKLAAQLLAPDANLNIPTSPVWETIKRFWLTVVVCTLLCVGTFFFIRRRKKTR